MINELEILHKCPLFAGMSDLEISMTLDSNQHREVEFPNHDVYTLAGMPCRYADIVLTGTLVSRMSSISGKQVEVSKLRPGNIIAPAFIFAKDRKMPVSVETEGKVTVLRFTPETLSNMLQNDSKLMQNFVRILSNINVFLTEKMRVLSLFTVREKVAWLLMERMGEQGSNTIHLYRSRQEIADSFGIQKFSLLRVLADFEKKGAIKVNGKEITIIDRNKMK